MSRFSRGGADASYLAIVTHASELHKSEQKTLSRFHAVTDLTSRKGKKP